MPAEVRPVPGSVIAMAYIVSPVMNPGIHRFFCSSWSVCKA